MELFAAQSVKYISRKVIFKHTKLPEDVELPAIFLTGVVAIRIRYTRYGIYYQANVTIFCINFLNATAPKPSRGFIIHCSPCSWMLP